MSQDPCDALFVEIQPAHHAIYVFDMDLLGKMEGVTLSNSDVQVGQAGSEGCVSCVNRHVPPAVDLNVVCANLSPSLSPSAAWAVMMSARIEREKETRTRRRRTPSAARASNGQDLWELQQ